MEEESEQLDYDEDVLEAAQKKAKELRQELIVSQQSSIQPSSLPSTVNLISIKWWLIYIFKFRLLAQIPLRR